MKVSNNLTDRAVLRELGTRLARRRIDADLTQAELAEQAGISKRTVERMEAGDGSDMIMLIRALRVLKLFDGLENLVPDIPHSPMALLKQKGHTRKRVGRRRRANADLAGSKPPRPWKWGEE